MSTLLDSLSWALSSALVLAQMWQFRLVRGLVQCILQVTRAPPAVDGASVADCALVSDILHRRKLPVALASAADFILGQPRVQPAEYALGDAVSLYCITEHEAIFVELPPGVDPYAGASAPSPFLFDTQFQLAVRVVRMPLGAMLRLSNQVAVDPRQIILLSNTTRCGSMLLCDMLEAVPGMRVLREPDALTCCLLLGGSVSADAQRAVVRAVVRILCKPPAALRAAAAQLPTMPSCPRFAIKPRGHCIKLLQPIDAALPGLRHLFLYRDGLPTVQSMTRAYSSEPVQLVRYWLMQSAVTRRLFPASAAGVTAVTVISDDPALVWARAEDYFVALPVFAKNALLWAVIVRTYVRCHESGGVRIAACRLEDLDADPERFCAAAFEWLGIAAAHAPLAAAAAVRAGDAHGASIFSRSRLARFRVTTVDSPALKRQLDELCDGCGVPRLGEPAVLPGTLGHSGVGDEALDGEADGVACPAAGRSADDGGATAAQSRDADGASAN
jgi:hypothetical protein